MVRLIPWALPTIPGDSEGGYTPQPTPGPVRVDPYNFENASVYGKYANTTVGPDKIYLIGSDKNQLSGTSFRGIEIVDSYGVASMKVIVTGTNGGQATINLDIEQLTVSSATKYSKAPSATGGYSITKYQWFVYNGAGEIIQQYERTVS